MGLKKFHWNQWQKTFSALRQSNLTLVQLPFMLREFRLWWQVTRNFREIEGSWIKALKCYGNMFEGIPKKRMPPSPADLEQVLRQNEEPAGGPEVSS